MSSAAGAVYDRGYRPFEGGRLGRRGARTALFRASIRRALGLRRSWRQKVFPWLLLALATLPAIVNVGVLYLTRDSPVDGFEPFTFREYVGVSTTLLLFVALTAPDLVCPDRRYRMLPLVLSRPLTGLDYAAIKFLAVFSVTFAFGFLPQVVLFVGRMLVADGALDFARENAEVTWQAPVAVAVLTAYYSAVGLAMASLTARRVIAAVLFLGALFASGIISAVVVGEEVSGPHMGELADLVTLPLKLRDVIFLGRLAEETALSGVDGGALLALGLYVAVLAAALATLALRYRDAEA